ncbi:MAG TPA: RecX family transcriptional regulator [Ardenticatenaceae bacterium]|nr:RecX family transcriptional regulator [Ardenticatenaceae bacterium]
MRRERTAATRTGRKITKLEAQQRNKERVNVYLDGTFAFGLALIEAARLQVGQELTAAEVERLKQADGYHRAHDRALAYLSYRPRSTTELRRYLQQKEVPDEHIERIVERLTTVGLLDDEAFARFWVENRETHRPRGSRALQYELRQKGVEAEAIETALEELDEAESAYRAAEQKRSRFERIADRTTFFRTVGGYLARRGFSWDAARGAAERLWRECQSSDIEEELDDGSF